ncbi:MAG: response regulator transcription factor, partial [Clostridia bacterium]|nr:response regulator transcription factor [Clostridia bacterium]
GAGGGLSLLDRRPDRSVPALLMVKKSNLADRERGLRLGAEGCILKPVETGELVQRVTEALRRARRSESCFVLDRLVVDMEAREAFLNGEHVDLTPQEYNLLEVLIVNRNLSLSREKLLALAWGFDYAGATRTVDVHVQKLRKKLRLEKRIRTVYKLGYRLEAQ